MKNIKNKILIFGLASVLLGCSQSATSVLDKEPIYAQNMQYSKVIKEVQEGIVNAIFNVTYLNSVDTKKWDDNKQHFLVGIYAVDNNASKYTLSMNGQKQILSTPVSKKDPIYKNIAFRNHWGEYKIVTFDNSDKKNVTLSFIDAKDNNTSVSFIKE